MEKLTQEIQACSVCDPFLPHGCRPVFRVHSESKILVIGQAPGRKVHESGIPWDDQSGKNLRDWMGIDSETFYDASKIGIVPMGFCYPGTGKSGDLPPRKECAPLWHEKVMTPMKSIRLTLLIGTYAQTHYLGESRFRTLTETVSQFEEFLPSYLPLPHPSPRNNIWMKKNPWFKDTVLPILKTRIADALKDKR